MSKKIFGIRKAILIFIFWILPKFALMETNTYGDIFNPDNSGCSMIFFYILRVFNVYVIAVTL